MLELLKKLIKSGANIPETITKEDREKYLSSNTDNTVMVPMRREAEAQVGEFKRANNLIEEFDGMPTPIYQGAWNHELGVLMEEGDPEEKELKGKALPLQVEHDYSKVHIEEEPLLQDDVDLIENKIKAYDLKQSKSYTANPSDFKGV